MWIWKSSWTEVFWMYSPYHVCPTESPNERHSSVFVGLRGLDSSGTAGLAENQPLKFEDNISPIKNGEFMDFPWFSIVMFVFLREGGIYFWRSSIATISHRKHRFPWELPEHRPGTWGIFDQCWCILSVVARQPSEKRVWCHFFQNTYEDYRPAPKTYIHDSWLAGESPFSIGLRR